jgi:choline dehydrogenase
MDSADHVIIGAGTAGCVLAARLSQTGDRVVVLEAGGSDRNLLIRAPGGIWPIMRHGLFSWRYETAPQSHLGGRRFKLTRGKVLGGSGSTNGLVYSRGAAIDWDWREFGLPEWTPESILPWFRQVESHPLGSTAYHGADGPMRLTRPGTSHALSLAFLAAAHQSGFPLNEDTDGELREGFGPLDLMVFRGRRWSTADAYLRPALRRPNVDLRLRAQVLRVLFDGGRAVGAEYRRGGQQRQIRAAKGVYLCAGTFHSPQLLQLSGIGPATRLRDMGIAVLRDKPGVGAGLRDHIAVTLKCTVPQPITLLRYRQPWRLALAVAQYLLAHSGPLANPGFEVVGFARSRRSLAWPDLRFQLLQALMRQDRSGMIPAHGFQIRASLARPTSTGSVELASADPFEPPRINQNYLSDPEEIATLREAIHIMRRLCAAPAFAALHAAEIEPGRAIVEKDALDEFIRSRADPDYHSVGTCRMGNDATAVVDGRFRVHDLEGLFVVDASVFPKLVDAGTFMPTIVVAERAAAMLSRT